MKQALAAFFLQNLLSLEEAYFEVLPTRKLKEGEELTTEEKSLEEKSLEKYRYNIKKNVITNKLIYSVQRNIDKMKAAQKRIQKVEDQLERVFKRKYSVDDKRLSEDKEYETEINKQYNEFLREEAQMEEKNRVLEAELEFVPILPEHIDESILPSELKDILRHFVIAEEEKEADSEVTEVAEKPKFRIPKTSEEPNED